MFLGALIVGVTSNLYARWSNRPGAITLVPGVLLLVPGTIGFRSVAALVENRVVSGVETAFTTILMAVALVAGLFIGNMLLPERRLG